MKYLNTLQHCNSGQFISFLSLCRHLYVESKRRRRVWQRSGYKISAAIRCEPLHFFRQTTICVSG